MPNLYTQLHRRYGKPDGVTRREMLQRSLSAAAALLLGAGFLRHALAVWRDRQDAAGRSLTGDAPARKAFRYSLSYLGLLFIALAADRMLLG